MRLDAFCAANGVPPDRAALDNIFIQTRDAAYRIIERKGATYYAVAAGLMRITEAVLRNQNTVLSVSSLIRDYHGLDHVCLSLPAVINRNGIENILRLDLCEREIAQLQSSA